MTTDLPENTTATSLISSYHSILNSLKEDSSFTPEISAILDMHLNSTCDFSQLLIKEPKVYASAVYEIQDLNKKLHGHLKMRHKVASGKDRERLAYHAKLTQKINTNLDGAVKSMKKSGQK